MFEKKWEVYNEETDEIVCLFWTQGRALSEARILRHMAAAIGYRLSDHRYEVRRRDGL